MKKYLVFESIRFTCWIFLYIYSKFLYMPRVDYINEAIMYIGSLCFILGLPYSFLGGIPILSTSFTPDEDPLLVMYYFFALWVLGVAIIFIASYVVKKLIRRMVGR